MSCPGLGHSAGTRLVALAVSTSEPEQPGRQPNPPEAVAADGAVPTLRHIGGGRGWLRRAALTALVIFGALVVGVAAMLLATPSVGNAWSLARAQARSHNAAFPGPPVPPRFAAALISTEDHRFASEPGFDPLALGRVLMSMVTGKDQGGATLYQQLAKLLYARHKSRLTVEIYELALGIKLKFSYSREQILRMYADVAYFGHGYYGLAAASCGYFGRRPADLSWPQSAVLAGLVQAPSAYDPLQRPALARSREGHVISRLVATGALTSRQGAAAFAVPMDRLLARTRGCRT
jgi:membrane peptidoglycan carboxypeptidase